MNKNKLGRYFCLILLLNITIASLPFSALVLADTPTETILLDDGFEGVDWDANWDNIASSWYRSTYRHSGSYAAAAMSGRAGAFTTDPLDASDAQAIHVEFWFMKYLTDATDYTLFYYDGTSYVHIDELENNGGDYPAWVHYTDTVTDSRFFVSNFRIRVYLTADSSQQGWIDDVLITKDISVSLDLYDDDETFWSTISGGSGNIDISISEDTNNMVSGSSSLKFDIISGTKSWVNIVHTYGANQNWSPYNALSLWWNGKNTGTLVNVDIEASDWNNRFHSVFKDDFTGWRKIILPLNSFSNTGSPSWSTIHKIYIACSPASQVTWNLDLAQIEGQSNGNPPSASNVAVSPAFPTDQNDLRATYTYSDPDGDPQDISGREIHWYKNGVLQTGYNNFLVLPYTATSIGDTWSFTIRVSDGALLSPAMASSEVSVSGGSSPLREVLNVGYLSQFTTQQLVDIANTYDLVITWPAEFNRGPMNTIRANNPDMIFLMYRNIHATGDTNELSYAREKGWVLKDINGNEVYEVNWPNNKALDVGNVDFQIWLSNKLGSLVDSYGFTGIFGDNTNPLLETLYSVSADAINPRTGQIFTNEEYRDSMIAFVTRIQSSIGDGLFIGNGIGHLQGGGQLGFWNMQSLVEPLIDVEDGVMIEGLVRWGGESWRPLSSWIQDVEMLKYLSNKGIYTISWIIVYGNLPIGATKDQVAMYGIATHLLGQSGPYSYYRVAHGGESEDIHGPTENLGNPIEEYHKRTDSQVYEREYSNSLILVNPTYTDYTISLGATYKTLDGQTVTSITVSAHTGIILLNG